VAIPLKLQHSNPVVLAVANVNGAALNEYSVRPRELAREWITFWTIAALAGSGHSRDNSSAQIDPANHMIFRIGNVEAVVGRIRYAFGTIQWISWSAELR